MKGYIVLIISIFFIQNINAQIVSLPTFVQGRIKTEFQKKLLLYQIRNDPAFLGFRKIINSHNHELFQLNIKNQPCIQQHPSLTGKSAFSEDFYSVPHQVSTSKIIFKNGWCKIIRGIRLE